RVTEVKSCALRIQFVVNPIHAPFSRQRPRFRLSLSPPYFQLLIGSQYWTQLSKTVLDPLTIKTNPGKSARQGREPSRNKIAHRRFCTFHTSSWHSCPSLAGCRRDR